MSGKQILLVDDNNGQRLTLESILKKSGYSVVSADCGNAALSRAENVELAAALLDIKMPDMTGIDVLKHLKNTHPDITIIMMTGYAESEFAIDALNAGAAAYILKPANIEQVKSLLNQALEHQRLLEENRAMAAALQEWNQLLETRVKDRTNQLVNAQKLTLKFYDELKKNFESTLEVLAIAIDQRDPLTYSHSFRVTQYAQEIGHVMGVSQDDLEKLRYAGLMHDLGKIEVKQEILCKEGSLTSEEYQEIQAHAHGTFELLSKFKFKSSLSEVPLIASSHHERFDGNGYPRKLKGDAIPLLARILAVADVLDAITSKRHYRTAMTIDNALNVLNREAGGHFDPQCIAALMKVTLANFIKIHLADQLSDYDTTGLIDIDTPTLADIYAICQAENPTAEQLVLIQQFHQYYQGPLPAKFAGKIEKAA